MGWLEVPPESPYGLDALPYGVFTPGEDRWVVGVRAGDDALDLAAVAAQLRPELVDVLAATSLNPLMARGPLYWQHLRDWVVDLLTDPANEPLVRAHLHPVSEVRMRLPIEVADYVDFYASADHATNVGKIFRPDSRTPLSPNWKHLPIGYHGRAGTVVVSGTDIVRPRGQRKDRTDEVPVFGPSTRLDLEAELGFVVGRDSSPGQPVPIGSARDYIFGVVVLNDWSARDLQMWESVPLGPFLGKSFGTSISAWVLPLAALADAEVALPTQDPEPLPYLVGAGSDRFGLDIELEVSINGTVVSHPSYRRMYWSPAQMLAHLTVNGASTRVGDLFGSGTVSGAQRDTRGCLLELTWGGTEAFSLEDGSSRTYLEDGDVVRLTAWGVGPNGTRIGLGEVIGTIQPAPIRAAAG